MGHDIHKPAVIAAIVILLLVAVLVRARALFTHRTIRNATPRNSRRFNTPVAAVPPLGVRVQPANRAGGGIGGHAQHPRAQHPQRPQHFWPASSVTSLRYPPPAYPAHRLDPPDDGVARGHLVGCTVDIVLAPLPPPYTNHPGGDHLPF
ncbi:hypothetical protein FS837_003348 [Tulasnella sp. UAMH 9824]|nr:hypothetical protein FS837_003348 [Tulasnella sp. UAMH 9824]